MTDMEIFNWLYNLEPESKTQKKKIERMMRIIIKKDYYDNSSDTENFLDTLTDEDVINRPSKEVYAKYKEWCKQYSVTPDAKNIFGSAVQENFNVKSTATRIKGKSLRVYRRS